MTEISRPWSGTTVGDSGPYSDDQWTDVWATPFGPVVASEGVFRDQLNELVASGAASPVAINTGRAIVDGSWYQSDASEDIAIPTPAANPRIDRIVLRKDWALQTIRLTRIAGAEAASPVPPAITQVDGTTWDLPLWQVHITVAPVMTIFADERAFVGQYNPTGNNNNRVYVDDDFIEGSNRSTGDIRRIWSAIIDASGNIDGMTADADSRAGGLSWGHDGVNPNDGAQLSGGKYGPNNLNADIEMRLKSPNTDANLDRYFGFLSDSQDITPANGIFFRQEGAGNWFGVTRSGGVETTIDMGVGATDTIKLLRFKVFGTTAVAFFLNGTFVDASITNVPTLTDVDLRIGVLDDGVAPAAGQYMETDRVQLQGDR